MSDCDNNKIAVSAGEAVENVLRIPLTRGLFALIDAADVHLVDYTGWHAYQRGHTHYARANTPGKNVRMHRVILCAPADKWVDHINGDGLDNRRCNIRLCTPTESARNRRTRHKPYRGVFIEGGRFVMRIKGGDKRYVRTCDSAEEAARQYDKAAKYFFGEFASLNFPEAK